MALTAHARYRDCVRARLPEAVSIGVHDACRSDDVGAVALGGMEKEELKGLDVSVFSRAPPQALLTTLEHLKCANPLSALLQTHACSVFSRSEWLVEA